jgi:MmgE/PrpD N-terminal domain
VIGTAAQFPRIQEKAMNVAALRQTSHEALAPERSTLISEDFARFVFEASAIPAPAVARAKHLILDGVGIALASTGFDFAHRALAAIAGLAGAGDTPVIGMPAKLPLRDAALINGILIHGLDFDDTHTAGVITRPAACCLPRSPWAVSGARAAATCSPLTFWASRLRRGSAPSPRVHSIRSASIRPASSAPSRARSPLGG